MDWRYSVRNVDDELRMRTSNLGVSAGCHSVELFAILLPFKTGCMQGIQSREGPWKVVIIWPVPMPPILAYYMNLVINEHLASTAVWHVATLEFVMLLLMRSSVVLERSAVG